MTPDDVLSLGQQAFRVIVLLTAPPLLSALCVGLLVGMFQAATSINEATLSFIPKLFTLGGVIFFIGPWMLEIIINYVQDLYHSIPSRIG